MLSISSTSSIDGAKPLPSTRIRIRLTITTNLFLQIVYIERNKSKFISNLSGIAKQNSWIKGAYLPIARICLLWHTLVFSFSSSCSPLIFPSISLYSYYSYLLIFYIICKSFTYFRSAFSSFSLSFSRAGCFCLIFILDLFHLI